MKHHRASAISAGILAGLAGVMASAGAGWAGDPQHVETEADLVYTCKHKQTGQPNVF